MGYLKKVKAKYISPRRLLLKYVVKLSSIMHKNLQTILQRNSLSALFASVPWQMEKSTQIMKSFGDH
jgi:hypothetical protein